MNLVKPRVKIKTSVSRYLTILQNIFFSKNDINKISDLESNIQSLTGSKFCIAMPSARTSIYLVIKSLIKEGDEVILSPYTIADVVNMVICAGAKPVFADIEHKTCNISPETLLAAITKKTAVVLVTHFYGNLSDIDEISKICNDKNLLLIEDSAQAFGVRKNKRFSGTWGIAGIYSFGLYKNVNGFMGGAIVTNNQTLEQNIRKEIKLWKTISRVQLLKKVLNAIFIDLVTSRILFNFIFFPIFKFSFLKNIDFINNKLKIDVSPKLKEKIPENYKLKMSSGQAIVINHQINKVFEDDLFLRMKVASIYNKNLKGIKEILLPPIKEDFSHGYWYYAIQVKNRKALVNFLMKNNRDIAMSYHRNCSELACFIKWKKPCSQAKKVADSVVYLPTYPGYDISQVDKNIYFIKKFFGAL